LSASIPTVHRSLFFSFSSFIKGAENMKKITGLSAFLIMTWTAGTAHADPVLRDRANSIFKPIPERVAEVGGQRVVEAQVKLIPACRAAI
jgi:hypothetical protein